MKFFKFLFEWKYCLKDRKIVLEIMQGREAELKNGSKGVISQRVLSMFTEAKRVNSNEQHVDDDQNVQLVWFIAVSIFFFINSFCKIQIKFNFLVASESCGKTVYTAAKWKNRFERCLWSAVFEVRTQNLQHFI